MKIKRLFAVLIVILLLVPLTAEDWYVCLASFKSKQNAENYAKVLTQNKLPSRVYFLSTQGGDYYRVLYDEPVDSIKKARELRDKIAASREAELLKFKGLWVCSAKLEKVASNNLSGQGEQTVQDEYRDINEQGGMIPDEPVDVITDEMPEELPDALLTTEEPVDEPVEETTDETVEETTGLPADVLAFTLPDCFSKELQEIINNFPINENFQLEELALYDLYHIRQYYADIEDLIVLNSLFNDNDVVQNVQAVSVAQYSIARNSEGQPAKKFSYTIASGNHSCFAKRYEELKNLNSKADETGEIGQSEFLQFKVKEQLFEGFCNFDENKQLIFQAFSPDNNQLIVIKAFDFSKEDFKHFLNDFTADSSIVFYPQVQDKLLVLPSKHSKSNHAEKERLCMTFKLSRLTENYAKNKNAVEWATALVGKWCTDSLFYQDGKKLSFSLFELGNDAAAKEIYQTFVDKHYETDITTNNHPSNVNDIEGWYIYNPFLSDSNEISFVNSEYIVSVNSYYGQIFTEAELIEFVNDLNLR